MRHPAIEILQVDHSTWCIAAAEAGVLMLVVAVDLLCPETAARVAHAIQQAVDVDPEALDAAITRAVAMRWTRTKRTDR